MVSSSKRIKTDELNQEKLSLIKRVFQNNGLIVMPTESIYGIACRMEPLAFEKLYSAKLRSYDKPLPVLISSLDQLYDLAIEIPEIFYCLADRFLPGPLTVILKKNPKLNYACFDQNSIAIRFSSHEITQKIAQSFGKPLLLSSANISGGPNLEKVDQIELAVGDLVEAIIDDGDLKQSIPSTILSFVTDKPKILREGAILRSDLDTIFKKL